MAKVTTEFDIELAKWQAKIAQIKADMKGTKAAAKQTDLGGALFGSLKGMLPAIGVGAAVAGIKGMLNQMDDLADISVKLGETPEVLQRVDMAAQRLASVSVDGVANSILKLERALGDVDNAAGRDALDRFGLSAETLMAMPLDEKILALSAAFQEARTSGSGLADLQDLMGRSAAELIPLFEAGSEEIKYFYEGAAVVANEAVYEMAALNDEFDMLIKNAQAGGKTLLVSAYDYTRALVAGVQWMFGDTSGIDAEAQRLFDRSQKAEETVRQQRAKRESRASNIQTQIEETNQQKSDRSAEQASKEEESRKGRIEALKGQIESERISLLPPEERLTELQNKMEKIMQKAADAFGAPMDYTMEGLLAAAEKLDGTFEGDEAFLKLVKEAQAAQKDIDSTQNELAKKTEPEEEQEGVKSANTPGSVAGALNILFGRSANELLLDESKQQTAAVKDNTRVLTRIENLLKDPNRRAQVMGAFPEVFAP
jgi:hypothetical protein